MATTARSPPAWPPQTTPPRALATAARAPPGRPPTAAKDGSTRADTATSAKQLGSRPPTDHDQIASTLDLSRRADHATAPPRSARRPVNGSQPEVGHAAAHGPVRAPVPVSFGHPRAREIPESGQAA